MACLNFDCECFNGVLNLLRYSNVFELNIGSELRCGGTFLQKWNKSMKMSFQNAVDQVRYLFPHLNLDSVGLDHRKVVKEGKAILDEHDEELTEIVEIVKRTLPPPPEDANGSEATKSNGGEGGKQIKTS
ncbi:hypothetical protein HN51_055273 [Arachis hypogaea]